MDAFDDINIHTVTVTKKEYFYLWENATKLTMIARIIRTSNDNLLFNPSELLSIISILLPEEEMS